MSSVTNSIRKPVFVVVCLLLCTVMVGCGIQSKDAVISDMIRGGNSVKAKVLGNSNGVIGDYKVYRDGQKDGVVFETVFARDVVLDESQLTEANVKNQMRQSMAGDPNTKKVLARGIYIRVLYKKADGSTALDVNMDASDF